MSLKAFDLVPVVSRLENLKNSTVRIINLKYFQQNLSFSIVLSLLFLLFRSKVYTTRIRFYALARMMGTIDTNLIKNNFNNSFFFLIF